MYARFAASHPPQVRPLRLVLAVLVLLGLAVVPARAATAPDEPALQSFSIDPGPYLLGSDVVVAVASTGTILYLQVRVTDSAGKDHTLSAEQGSTAARARISDQWATGPITVQSVMVTDALWHSATYDRGGGVSFSYRNGSATHELDLPSSDFTVLANDHLPAPELLSAALLDPGPLVAGDEVAVAVRTNVQQPDDELLHVFVVLVDAAGRTHLLSSRSADDVTAVAKVDRFWADGPAHVQSVQLLDRGLNESTYRADGWLQRHKEAPTTHDVALADVTVAVHNPEDDRVAPELTGIELLTPGVLQQGDEVAFAYEISDRSPVTTQITVTDDRGRSHLLLGGPQRTTATVNVDWAPGVLRVSEVRVTDEYSNSTQYIPRYRLTRTGLAPSPLTFDGLSLCTGRCLRPEAPAHLAASADGTGGARVTWSPPSDDGGSPVTAYDITVAGVVGCSTDGDGRSCVVTGLEGGRTSAVAVTARNGLGVGPAATTSVATPATAPDAPTGVLAVGRNDTAQVAWQPARSNGSPVLAYVAVATPGGSWCRTTGTSCTITGLPTRSPVSVQVTVATAIGTATSAAVATTTTALPFPVQTPPPSVSTAAALVFAFGGYTFEAPPWTGPVFDVRYRRATYSGSLGPWAYPVTWQGRTARTVSLPAVTGTTTCFSFRIRDRQGLASAWTGQQCTATPTDDRALTASPGWTRDRSGPSYASTTSTTSRAGATLRLGVQAQKAWVLVTRCHGCGRLGVYLDGRLLRTVDLEASRTAARVLVPVLDVVQTRRGTLVLRSLTGERVWVDGVVIGASQPL